MSPIEQGLLFHYLLEEEDPYVDQMVCEITGELDVHYFEETLRRLVALHDGLRTAYARGVGLELQGVVRERTGACMVVVDLSDEVDPRAVVNERVAADAKTRFDLSRQASRCTLYRLEERVHVFAWTYHHVVADSWALRLLQEQFCAVYRALVEGTVGEHCRATSYKAYVDWIKRQDRDSALSFWTEKLRRLRSRTAGGPTPPCTRGGYASVHATLSSEMRKRVDDVRRRCKVTINTVLLAMWGILALEQQQTTDCLVGCVMFGRAIPVQGIENMVGVCANTAPMVIDATRSIRGLLAELQADVFASNAHSYLALCDILASAGLNHGDMHSVVNFTVDEKTVRNEHLAHLPFETTNVRYTQAANFDAYLDVEVHAAGFEMTIHFDPTRRHFVRDEVERKCERIVRYMVEHTGGTVRDALDFLLVDHGRLDSGFAFDAHYIRRPLK